MNDGACNREDPTPCREEAYRLADALVTLGEGKAAVDLIRREVNAARSSLPATSLTLFRLLSQYAAILESTDALAEAEFIRAEALEIVVSAQITTQEAVDAFLKYGLLLCKMHNYDGAVARLKEAVRRAEELEDIGSLHRQIILAQAWRSQAQAFEALGEFSQASNALDVLMNVKRHIRFIVFAPSHER
jgi:tetratricopeptide (TPR) repeat protein